MGLSFDPMFSSQPSPSILPQVGSWCNLPYLAIEGDNGNPPSDSTLAITSSPFDLPQDLNLAKVTDETLGTPSSTASEGLGFQLCDICFKLLKGSDFRYVFQQDLSLISTESKALVAT